MSPSMGRRGTIDLTRFLDLLWLMHAKFKKQLCVFVLRVPQVNMSLCFMI